MPHVHVLLQVLSGVDGYRPPPGGVVAIDASRIGNISRYCGVLLVQSSWLHLLIARI